MKFQIAGLNHRTAPVEIRERVAFNEDGLGGALDCLRQRPGLLEGMILSTCNRVEIAITADEQTDPEEAIECFLSEIREIQRDWVAPYLYHYSGQDAVQASLPRGIQSRFDGRR